MLHIRLQAHHSSMRIFQSYKYNGQMFAMVNVLAPVVNLYVKYTPRKRTFFGNSIAKLPRKRKLIVLSRNTGKVETVYFRL